MLIRAYVEWSQPSLLRAARHRLGWRQRQLTEVTSTNTLPAVVRPPTVCAYAVSQYSIVHQQRALRECHAKDAPPEDSSSRNVALLGGGIVVVYCFGEYASHDENAANAFMSQAAAQRSAYAASPPVSAQLFTMRSAVQHMLLRSGAGVVLVGALC